MIPELFRFQKEGVTWLREHDRAILADEQGLGKTPQAILAWNDFDAVLIVATVSKVQDWVDEVRRWRPDATVRSVKEFEFPRRGEVIVVAWSRLPEPIGNFKVTFPDGVERPLLVVFDEAHTARNVWSNKGMSASVLSEYADKAWLLTGTPLVTDPEALQHLCYLANPRKPLISPRWFDWGIRRDSRGKAVGCRWFLRWKLEATILRRERSVVMPNLPSKTYSTWRVHNIGTLDLPEFEGWLRDRRGHVERSWFATGKNRLARMKFERVKDRLLAEATIDDPLIVFSASKDPVLALERERGWVAIHGGVSSTRRATIVRDFQAGKYAGLALTGSGAEGLNLTRAHRMVMLDLEWTEATNFQVEDRTVRHGQVHPVEIIVVVSDHPLDDYVLDVLGRKETVAGSWR